LAKRRTIEVICRCGSALARYEKRGKGRLIKMFFERIAVDRAGVFLCEPPLPLDTEIFCPDCGKRIAVVRILSGKYAAKLNQGGIRPM